MYIITVFSKNGDKLTELMVRSPPLQLELDEICKQYAGHFCDICRIPSEYEHKSKPIDKHDQHFIEKLVDAWDRSNGSKYE